MARLVLIGGGGFAMEVLAIAESAGDTVVGYCSPTQTDMAVPYLGDIAVLAELKVNFDAVILAFGATNRKSIQARASTIAALGSSEIPFKSAISPQASIAIGAKIGVGSVIAPFVIVAVDAVVGEHCVLNGASQVGHHSVLERNVTLAPLAFVAGRTCVGSNSLIGPHSSVLQGLKLGNDVIVGTGTSVTRDVPDSSIIVPSRFRTVAEVKR